MRHLQYDEGAELLREKAGGGRRRREKRRVHQSSISSGAAGMFHNLPALRVFRHSLCLRSFSAHAAQIFAVEKKMAHQNLTPARFDPAFSVLNIPSMKRSSSKQSIWTTLCICCLPGGILVHYSDEKYRGLTKVSEEGKTD